MEYAEEITREDPLDVYRQRITQEEDVDTTTDDLMERARKLAEARGVFKEPPAGKSPAGKSPAGESAAGDPTTTEELLARVLKATEVRKPADPLEEEIAVQDVLMARMQHALSVRPTAKDMPKGTAEEYVWGDDESPQDFLVAADEIIPKIEYQEKRNQYDPSPVLPRAVIGTPTSSHLVKEGLRGVFKELTEDINKRKDRVDKLFGQLCAPQHAFVYKDAANSAAANIREALKAAEASGSPPPSEEALFMIAQDTFDKLLAKEMVTAHKNYKTEARELHAYELAQRALARIKPMRLLGEIIKSARSIRDAKEEASEENPVSDEEVLGAEEA